MGLGPQRSETTLEALENLGRWRSEYKKWLSVKKDAGADEVGPRYPWVTNPHAPFTAARRAISMTNLALISSAGAYIDGTEPLSINLGSAGPVEIREIPVEVEAQDLLYAAGGYSPEAVRQDRNTLIPIDLLQDYAGNGVIGQLNPVWWSFSGYAPNAERIAAALPALVERVRRYDVQAALLVPASRLCHQSCGLIARALEAYNIPTMMLAVERTVPDRVRPPRTAYYDGEIGQTVGPANWPEKQRRVLDEALRLIEPLDQPTVWKLTVDLETEVEQERGER